jgi:hypothetical protein
MLTINNAIKNSKDCNTTKLLRDHSSIYIVFTYHID